MRYIGCNGCSTILLVALSLNAQVTSRISGYVKDSSGAIVPNATLKATSVEQRLTRTTQSDSTGYYEFLAMPASNYEIEVDSTGFQHQTQKGVALQSSQNLRLDIVLGLREVHAEVTITGAATLVNTSTATVASVVDDRRVQDLPLNGRNIVSLTEILPGVTDISAPETMSNTRSGPVMSVNGSRQVDNNFLFNGANWTNFAQSTGMNY